MVTMNERYSITQGIKLTPRDLHRFPGMMFSRGLVAVKLTSRYGCIPEMTTYVPIDSQESVTRFVNRVADDFWAYGIGIEEICFPNELFDKYMKELEKFRLSNKE